ncbi:MAG: hypothetical protein Q9169_008458, partial [Polycauliona sp. 2 TL-2023]
MVHKILHQTPQFPPRDPTVRIALLWKHAHGTILPGAGTIGMTGQAGDMLAIVILAVGIGAFDEAAEALHGVAFHAAPSSVGTEAGAVPGASAVDAEGGDDLWRQEADGEDF